MIGEILKLLKYNNLRVSKSFLRLRIESHPDYPSLFAIQSTLSELGIYCEAFEMDINELKEVSKPFAMHLNSENQRLKTFYNFNKENKNLLILLKKWSGIVLLIDQVKKIESPLESLHRRYQGASRWKYIFFSLLLVFLSFILVFINPGHILLLLILSCFLGILFSGFIIQKEIGIANRLRDRICSISKKSGCEKVLSSKRGRLFKWLSWGDIGLAYFSSFLIYCNLVLLQANVVDLSILLVISVVPVLFLPYSLFVQWRLLKRWCILCLLVLFVLSMQGIISLSFIEKFTFHTPLISTLSFFYIFFFLLSFWKIIKPHIQNSENSLNLEIVSLKFKRNPKVFNALLSGSEINQSNFPLKDELIKYGNINAPYKIVIACNPYCDPCRKAHNALEEVYEKFPDKLLIAIRFAVRNVDFNDERTRAVSEIIKVANFLPYQSVKDWYALLNLEDFKSKYKDVEERDNILLELQRQIEWTKKEEIKATPTFFINGNRLPKIYSWKEFIPFLESQLG